MFLREENKKLPKLIAVLGPTAVGKTSWSLSLAKKFNGEIISADSRQIYRKMNIGTAKPEGEWRRAGLRRTYFIYDVPHHLMDCFNPGSTFSVAEFRDKALKYAKMAIKNGRVPMLVGGTGLYISSIVDNFYFPRVAANNKLRKSLEQKSCDELFGLLHYMDSGSAKVIDKRNKRRMIRALEVCILTGESFSSQRKKGEQLFDVLQIAPDVPRDVLHERISERVDRMVEDGLVDEIKYLLKQNYSWDLPSMNGIGYKQFKEYISGNQPLEDAIKRLKRDTRRYARRQMTWFRRDSRVHWCKTYEEAENFVEVFLDS